MVLHPNAGAVLVVGLGCENNQPDVFREFLGEFDEDRVKFMVTQKVGDEYEEGMEILRDLYAKASKDERTDVPLSELRVGLKCGGSDGFSGITANPLLGMFSDFLIAQGGTSVLTEVPEMLKLEGQQVNKFAVYHPNACEEMCAPLFTPTWKDKTVMAAAGKEWMDCTAPGSGKGPSVAFLQEYLGISPDETCTFGDNLNDIEMLQNAGLSYAVSNSRPEVRAAAKNTCPPYWENGVLQILRSFL